MKKLYRFRETPRFTKRLLGLLSDDEYFEFQWRLIQFPESGDLIQGSSGIRKIRCPAKGKGKSGGVRMLYYFAVRNDEIFMLDIYAKNEKADLNPSEIKILRNVVEEWLNQ